MMALDLGDNWNKEFTRLALAKDLPTAKIWEIIPPYEGDSPATSLDFAKMYHDADIYLKPTTQQSQNTPLDNLQAFLSLIHI